MFDDRYDVAASPDFLIFEFVSTGAKGDITKVVVYSEINLKGFYNLGFGDKDVMTGFVSDLSVTGNLDRQKVLATVASTLFVFTEYYPDATIIATGSTEARTRLYRMGITNHLTEIEKDFLVLGLTKAGWEPFRKNIDYGAFLVRRKNVDL